MPWKWLQRYVLCGYLCVKNILFLYKVNLIFKKIRTIAEPLNNLYKIGSLQTVLEKTVYVNELLLRVWIIRCGVRGREHGLGVCQVQTLK